MPDHLMFLCACAGGLVAGVARGAFRCRWADRWISPVGCAVLIYLSWAVWFFAAMLLAGDRVEWFLPPAYSVLLSLGGALYVGAVGLLIAVPLAWLVSAVLGAFCCGARAAVRGWPRP